MDTAERPVASGEELAYDGFISYSHAADGLLAPRLQSGLQQFAKPWWKRRAVRIFRDESSLSANPHLWSSITEALDSSEWFVLLLSPDAAESPWVNQEIEYWREHKDPSRILPVLTGGSFEWSGEDVSGSAVPEQLRGAFTEEPRWVDLRFAQGEEQLDLKNPRFADAVADVASALRGVPKDELASEEVRQHRRNVRTAWGAATLIGVFAIAALVFAFQSASNAQRAEVEASRANQEADRAEREAERANREAERAEANAEVATREAGVARARELAASSVSVLDTDPELAMMLSLSSIAANPSGVQVSPEAVRTLREAQIGNRLTARFDTGQYAHLSPDGSWIAFNDSRVSQIVAKNIETGVELWRSEPIAGADLGQIDISPDGTIVTANVHDSDGMEVVVYEAASGRQITTLAPSHGCRGVDLEGISVGGGFSPSGEWFTAIGGTAGCRVTPGESSVVIYDTTSWAESGRLNTDDGSAFAAQFSEDGTRVLISSDGQTAELRTFPELETIARHEGVWSFAALSPDGERMAYLSGPRGPILADAETGEVIFSLAQAADAFTFGPEFTFSPDGSKVVVSTIAEDLVFDGRIGGFIEALPTEATASSSFSAEGRHLLTSNVSESLLWSFGIGERIADESFFGDWVNPDQASDGPQLAVNVIAFDTGLHLALLDSKSREVVASRRGWGYQLPNGRFVVLNETGSGDDYRVGPLEVWDPVDGSVTELAGCIASQSDLEAESGPKCPVEDEALFAGLNVQDHYAVVIDASGTFFAAQSSNVPRRVFVWNQEDLSLESEFVMSEPGELVGMTQDWVIARSEPEEAGTGLEPDRLLIYDLDGELLSEIRGSPGEPFERSVLTDATRNLLYAVNRSGTVSVIDLGTWDLIATFDIHRRGIRGWQLSPDMDQLAAGTQDGNITVWDVSGLADGENPGAPTVTLDVGQRVSDVSWISDQELAAFYIDRLGARWFTLPLSTDDLVDRARQRLIRGYTPTECATYRLDPCPTLEDLKGG